MIVTCAACETRYLVDEAALGADAGRRVRCANCGHLWQYAPEAGATGPAADASAAEAPAPGVDPVAAELPGQPVLGAAEPNPQPVPTVGSAGPRATEPIVPRVRESAHDTAALGLILAAVVVVAAIAVYGAFRSQHTVVALWDRAKDAVAALTVGAPPTAGKPAAPAEAANAANAPNAAAGLEVTVTPVRTPDALVIKGNIVNSAAVARTIPRLRVTLRDHNKIALVSKVIDPPAAQLAPGATAHFNTVFEHPSIAATGVAVTFATD